MDPYKVLGIDPETSDDDIKRAYREMARKYHPDNYAGSPLADLAETRMKEINEAYDLVMESRSNGGSASAGVSSRQNSGYTAGGSSAGSSGFAKVRDAINKGNLSLAEELLQRSAARNAEWHFLMGTVYFRKGWYDEARSAYTQACNLDPNNAEYRNALNMVNMGAGYNGYRPMASMSMCDCCTTMLCMNCCCNSCCGGGC